MRMPFGKWVSDRDWRVLLLIASFLSLLIFVLSVSSTPVQHFLLTQGQGGFDKDSSSKEWNEEVVRSRIAVCLVGGARRFELTGPSIVKMILKQYPNSHLFLHSPLDKDAFKFSLLKDAPNIAAVRIFQPQPLPHTDAHLRLLTAHNSPNGIQGLLQYFKLVEGCLEMIKRHERKNNMTYEWIVRTRVDGYWNGPLKAENFVRGKYMVPPGSCFGGLNDRFGIGDLNTSTVALSRLSLLPQLDSAGFTNLNSEAAFKAQLTTQGVPYTTNPLPFCILSDRHYDFPPTRYGVPVAALSSRAPLSGAKCRPCTPACRGDCVDNIMTNLEREWSWTQWENGTTLDLCDAHDRWEDGWETIFDTNKYAGAARKRIQTMKLDACLQDFKRLKSRAASWESPPVFDICTFAFPST
ncbi:DEP domain-containing mTOR-interacting protein [Senna tora]|uniref:DEP domain-containing mTOR-interacting protein n=1 Tax=Senna tora TaxID=362788 RepID=A0A834TAX9_9FABA|nr:DEP domain-containing mTOR-interacting protein [Senna tora]